MSECNNCITSAKPSLKEFVSKIRGNKYRLQSLYEKLEWVIHLMFSIPGPVYGGIPSHSNVQPDRIVELLDREDRIKRKIKAIKEEKLELHRFEKKPTENELAIFHMYFFKDMSQADIGFKMQISQQAVSSYIININKKWD